MLIVNKHKDTENKSCCCHQTGISTQYIYAVRTLHTDNTVSRHRVS